MLIDVACRVRVTRSSIVTHCRTRRLHWVGPSDQTAKTEARVVQHATAWHENGPSVVRPSRKWPLSGTSLTRMAPQWYAPHVNDPSVVRPHENGPSVVRPSRE